MAQLLIFFLMFSTLSSAKISGIIIDQKTSRPISDVEITISKTKIGTTSNAEGLFEISNNKREKLILIFNHIAYETKYHPINRIDTSLVIKLKETLLQMDDIVVTSMRSGYLLRDVPVSTEVIGKKEIQSSGAVTINDLLSQRSGVSSSVNVDGGSIFNLLGLDSRYILILKNGQPITGRFNNRVDLNHISVNRIKKIEITKGPGSALYGTDAMGGIINIITDDTNERKTINLNYRATSFGSNLEEISKEPVNDIYSSSIAVPINNFKIYNDVTYQNFSKGQQFEYIKSDYIKKINTNTDINWSNSNRHLFSFNLQTYYQGDNGVTRSAFGDILFNNSTKIQRFQTTLQYDWKYSERANLKQSLRIANYSREYLVTDRNNYIETENQTKEENVEYEVMYTKAYKQFNLVYGMEFSKPVYKSDRIKGGRQTLNQNGVFVQTDINISKKIDFVSGLRIDRFQDTVVVSPRFALSYKATKKTKFRAAYGHGFRSPSFMESLIDWEHIQFGYRVIGNQNLEPEVSRGTTLGIEFTNNKNFQISALIYRNQFKNLIEDYSVVPGLLSYRNISVASFKGFELSTKWAIGSKISLSSNYNYINNTDGKGDLIPNTIPHSFGSRISFSIFKNYFLLSLNTKIVGGYSPQEFDPNIGDYKSSKEDIDTYIISDMTVQYKINQKYKILAGLKNLGNYKDNTYGPYIGRTPYVEIQKIIDTKKRKESK